MENCKKYERQYFMPPKFEYDWVKKRLCRRTANLVRR